MPSSNRIPTAPAAGRVLVAPTLALALASALGACSSGNDPVEAFVVTDSGFVGVRDARNVIAGDLGVFLASEAAQGGGTDLNGDNDQDDLVAVAVRFDTLGVQNLGAAPSEVAIAGPYALLVVDETDNKDWNENGLEERVLLRWLVGSDAPEFVAVLDPDSPRGVVSTSDAFHYVVDEDPAGTDETNLRSVSVLDVDTELVVGTSGGGLGAGRVDLLGASQGLLLLAVDETDPASQGEANGDMDGADRFVLALVDAAADPPVAVNTGLALASADAPIEVRLRDTARYQLAVLVDEAAQGGADLSGGFTPAICGGAADSDADDAVLHLVTLDAGVVTVENTTIAGAGRVFLLDEYLGTLAPESSIGPAGCDLTNDGQTDDTVLRFAPLDLPGAPIDLDDLYLPIDTALPGGASGAAASGARFVAAIDAEFAVSGAAPGAASLAQLDPLLHVEWRFLFDDADDEAPPLGASLSSLSPGVVGGRASLALLEAGLGLNLNRGCGLTLKDQGAPDTLDSVPGTLRLTSGGGAVLSGYGFAVEPASPVQLAFGQAFFRVDEAADGFDWNGDGVLDDSSLFRHPLLSCDPVRMGDIDGGSDAPIVTDGGRGAFLFVDELDLGVDLNGDGVVGGLAVRYFRAF